MVEDEKRNINRATAVVGFFTFLSRVLGLVRDMVLAAFFGTGMVADAFVVAFKIPNLFRRLFAEGSLTISFIPVFTEYLTLKSKQDAFEMARVVFGILALILVVLSIAGVACAPWIVRLQAFGFGASGEKYELTVLLTRITFPYIFCISIVAFFMGVLNSLRHFGAPAAAPIFLNLGIIGAAFLISPFCERPVVGVAIGVIVGGVLQVALQIPWIMKSGLKIMPKWGPRHPAVKKIGLLLLPTVFGSAVYQLNSYVGTLLASLLAEGSVSWLYFADRLVQYPLGVFGIALGTAVLPSLAGQGVRREYEEFENTVSYSLRLVFFITLPATAGLIVLGEPLIRVLLQRHAFSETSTIMTARALFYYVLGLWAYAGIRVVVPAFYALQDTKTPVKAAVVALVVNFAAALVLMRPLGHGGIALALSVSSSVQFCLLTVLLKNKIQIPRFKGVLSTFLKSALAAAIMGLCIHLLHSRWLVTDSGTGLGGMLFHLSILIGSGIGIYFGMARVLGCSERTAVMDMFLSILPKRKGFG